MKVNFGHSSDGIGFGFSVIKYDFGVWLWFPWGYYLDLEFTND